MMKAYLKHRYKSYLGLVIGALLGFVLVRIFVDEPNYSAAWLAIIIGLILGELFVLIRWLKRRKKEA